MKYHCANMCECSMVTKSGKVLTFSVKKGKKTHCHKALGLESKGTVRCH